MLYKNLFSRILLGASFCFLCVSCTSMQESGFDNNSAAPGFQKEPVDQAASQERLGMDYLLGAGEWENKEQAFNWFKKQPSKATPTPPTSWATCMPAAKE